MSLLQRKMTSRLLAGNRSNSKRSTGPRTELGKRHASRNAGKHLVFARVVPPYMKELGEDPAEFEKLRQSLYKSFQPDDGISRELLEEMAENRWRRRRLTRAEAGIQATQRQNFKVERELNPVYEREDMMKALRESSLADFGLAGQDGSYMNCVQIRAALVALKESIEDVGFEKDNGDFLDHVYGSKGTLRGHYLRSMFDKCCEHPKSDRTEKQEWERREFFSELESEITRYRRLVELFNERDVETTEAMLDVQLLPSQESLDRLLRYGAFLDRQFERQWQMLVSWRRARGEAVSTDVLPFTHR